MEDTELKKILGNIEKRLEKVDGIDAHLDILATKVFEMDDRMDSFATKVELKDTESRLMTAIDRIAKGFENLSQEYHFMNGRFDRIEKHVGLAT